MKDVCIYLSCESPLGHLNDIRYPKPKSGSGAVEPKSTPRDTESTTFAKGIFQPTKSEVGGVEPKVPQPGSRVPSSTSSRPHPHARHDRSMARDGWWLGRFEDFVLLPLLLLLLRACPGPRGHRRAVNDHYVLFCHYLLEDMERTWSRYVRVTQ